MSAPAPGRRAGVALLLALVALAGCAAIERPLERDELAELLRSRGLDPGKVVLPYALTDEMKAWAHAAAPSILPPRERLLSLRDALFDNDRMKIEYTWGHTGTASEVFTEQRANCLAFTNLFLGMAREVGVPVYFLAVERAETYRREGDLVVVSDHVAVGHGEIFKDLQVFDFSEYQNLEYRDVRRLSDLSAIAMFHSNRGAEALQRGLLDDALDWLRIAIAIDPELAHAWVNLGVALRRAGDLDGAEDAYRKGLELDPRIFSAYQNLVTLLRLQDRDQEAAAYEEVLRRAPNRNPYSYLSLGDISLRNGRLEEAKRYYRRAASLGPDDPEIYAALGQIAAAEGDLRRARRLLKKAQKIDPDNPRTRQLAHVLRQI